MENKEAQQEMMMKFAMFEQQIRQIQEQLQAVEQSIGELGGLNLGLEELKGKKGEEIMAPIGRGIFARAKLLSEDLTVDIGGKNFVKKDIKDTKKLIDEQVAKLEEIRGTLQGNLQDINQEVMVAMGEAQKKEEGEKKGKKVKGVGKGKK